MEKLEGTTIQCFKRGEVKNYIISLNKYDSELISQLMDDYVNKDLRINMIRLRPNGFDSYISNNLETSIKKNKHWSCDWIYITDNDLVKNDYMMETELYKKLTQ